MKQPRTNMSQGIQDDGSFLSVMEPFLSLPRINNKIKLKYFHVFQSVKTAFNQVQSKKKFPLKTVMEPFGSITYC